MHPSADWSTDEAAIRGVIEHWAEAVVEKDLDGIVADHAPDVLMFDVPRPLQAAGLDAYRKTRDRFYSAFAGQGVFDVTDLKIMAGDDVGFATAIVECGTVDPQGKRDTFLVRLTVSLRKTNDRWLVAHEHHSVASA